LARRCGNNPSLTSPVALCTFASLAATPLSLTLVSSSSSPAHPTVRKVISYKSGDIGPKDLLTRPDRGCLLISWQWAPLTQRNINTRARRGMRTNVHRVYSAPQTLHRQTDPVGAEAGGRTHCAITVTLLRRCRSTLTAAAAMSSSSSAQGNDSVIPRP
jgi:hypothetical protein